MQGIIRRLTPIGLIFHAVVTSALPIPDSWTLIPPPPAWIPLAGHETVVWTGTSLIAWGTRGDNRVPGGIYDPRNRCWEAIAVAAAPIGRSQHTAVWTGTRMLVWGGVRSDFLKYLGDGGSYDPATDTWAPISTVGAPSPRYRHTAVWTGDRMIVWGGWSGDGALRNGGLYDPRTDRWTAISERKAPKPRRGHTAIWTGSRMVIWGGQFDGRYLRSGGIYDPIRDTWVPTKFPNAPSEREEHTAVWTGSRMLVWGGRSGNGSTLHADGASFDPAANAWAGPLGNDEGPVPADDHLAVWTGSRMIVWRGEAGWSYDPIDDMWEDISNVGAPYVRRGSALWTGSQMILMNGGFLPPARPAGGIYTPE